MKIVVFTFLLINVITATILCENNQVYVKVVKQSNINAIRESFAISAGDEDLYNSPEASDNSLFEDEVCLPTSSNNQYTLTLKLSSGSYWKAGSWLALYGEMGNCIFKGYLTYGTEEIYSISLYYGFMTSASWRISSGLDSENWTGFFFDDSTWTEATMGSVSVPVSGTQYLRKSFTGIIGMAAYELSMKYSSGIVAYINGVEVYRDNMPAGEVTASTLATSAYTTLENHVIIRPGIEVADSQSMFAVELHFLTEEGSDTVDFDAYLAIYSSTVSGNDLCYVYPYATTITTDNTSVLNPQWVFDFNSSTGSSFKADSISFIYGFASHKPIINGIRMWPSNKETQSPKQYTVQGSYKESSEWTTLITATSETYTNYHFNYVNSNDNDALYDNYRLTIAGSRSDYTYFFEAQLLICYRPMVIAYEQIEHNYSLHDSISITPVGSATNFTATLISGVLPKGVTLNESTGVISGVAENGVDTTLIVQFTNALGSVSSKVNLHVIVPIINAMYSQSLYKCSMLTECTIIPNYSDSGISYSLFYDNLPEGLSLSSNGVISGYITSKASSYPFIIKATNLVDTDYIELIIVVEAPSQDSCSGTAGRVIYSYSVFSEFATFTLVEKETGASLLAVTNLEENENKENIYEFCATGSHHVLSFTGGSNYLPVGSFLTVQLLLSNNEYETVGRTPMNRVFLGLPKEFQFNAHYSIPPKSTWYAISNSIPENWADENVDGWSQGSVGNFESISGRIQLYKQVYNNFTPSYYSAFVMSIRYQYGCIVYMYYGKRAYEVFRDGVDGDLSEDSVATTESADIKYRQINLNPKILHSQRNLSMFAIALVGKDDTQTADFDFALRIDGYADYSSRLFDYTVSSTITDVENAFDFDHTTYITTNSCTSNSIDIQFNNNRLEWINAIDIYIDRSQTTQIPSAFIVKARNSTDNEWSTLYSASGILFSPKRIHVRNLILNDYTHNMYRIEITGLSNDCEWKLTQIDLGSAHYVYMDTNYGFVRSLFVGDYVQLGNIGHPSNCNHTISPELPAGLQMDASTGLIFGIPTEAKSSERYTVTFTRLSNNMVYSNTVNLEILDAITCEEGTEMVNIYLDSNNKGNFVSVYSEDDSETPLYTGSNGNNRYCLIPGTYKLKVEETTAKQTAKNNSKKVQLSIDGFVFDYAVVEYDSLNYITKFSTVIPFKTTTKWNIFKGTVASNWYASNYDISEWAEVSSSDFGNFEATTVYVRKMFSIPSLDNYHVLNVQVKYTDGLIAYFNGNKVARFNLPASVDSMTLATSGSFEPITSSFSIILSSNDVHEDMNVMAFEIHSVSTLEREITFSAIGVYGVNECTPLTNSISSTILNNFYDSYHMKNYFDFNLSTDQSGINTSEYERWNIPLPETFNAYIKWSVDNLEPVEFNAFTFMYSPYNHPLKDCEVELQVSENMDSYSTVATSYNEILNPATRITNYASGEGVSSRNFKFVVPKKCYSVNANYHPSKLIPTFSEIHLSYCAAPRCPADGDYPAALNGKNSTIRCPAGYTGYKSRLCVNGILDSNVIDGCVAENKITYDRENTLLILVDQEISFTPSTLFPVSSFYLSGELPTGLSFDTATGTIHGTATESTSELLFSISAVDETYSTTTDIVLIVLETSSFAITKDAFVFDDNLVSVEKLPISSTMYDYYILDQSTEYVIIKQEGATVIPVVGDVWKYQRPVLSVEHTEYYHGGTGSYMYIITTDDAFTHYRYSLTTCPEGKSYVAVYNSDNTLASQYCVTPLEPLRVTTEADGFYIKDSRNNIVPATARHSFYNYYVFDTQFAESDTTLTDPENEGIVGVGPYYFWPKQVYIDKMMMNAPYSVSSSGIVPPRHSLEFGTTKKLLLFDYKLLDPLLGDTDNYETIENHNDYVTETALTLMEIVYFRKNQQKIVLSRTQLKEQVAEYCTESHCTTNWRFVIDALQNTGVCQEGTENDSSCKRYKIYGVNQESFATRNTKWIKEQLDSGNPVFVLLSLDPVQTQHHLAHSINPINKSAPGRMNFGGVVVGYNAEREGYEYWNVVVRRHGDDNNMIKVALSVQGKNFARITNYAFTIINVN